MVNISSEDEIVFEWWNNSNKLTVYVSQDALEYVKVWGKDMENEMEEGELSSFEDIKLLWEWIS